jgi:hypothetical protein
VAQHQPGHGARELPGQLRAAAAGEEVHHREVVGAAPYRLERRGRTLGYEDLVALLSKDQGQGLRIPRIGVHEKDPGGFHRFSRVL